MYRIGPKCIPSFTISQTNSALHLFNQRRDKGLTKMEHYEKRERREDFSLLSNFTFLERKRKRWRSVFLPFFLLFGPSFSLSNFKAFFKKNYPILQLGGSPFSLLSNCPFVLQRYNVA
jgi:hypothetical protein